LKKSALICGISGQDGAYLASLLLEKNYRVIGTSRDAQAHGFTNLGKLGIEDKVELDSMSLLDFRSVLQIITKYEPDEVYNLAGQSSVGLSFQQPVETLESIATGTLNLLEVIRFSKLPIKLYNAGSSECFGETPPQGADETTPFRPRSPYAVAKSTAYWQVANYREAYNLFACSGILFNHESPLRPKRFVTQKIISTAWAIKNGETDVLNLGNLNIKRDWGWAPEYVEAMWKMLQHPAPEDFVIATGESNSLEDFVKITFDTLDLDYREYVKTDTALQRPTDILFGKGNPEKAGKLLGWRAKTRMADVIKKMIASADPSDIK